LQAALRHVLGTHVNQAGSLVTPERLRFDFSHFASITQDELSQIEDFVNSAILANTPVGIIETSQETAKEMGAMALFGEKYGETVRVIVVGNVSCELCGGTHVEGTGEIGLFRIVSESSVGAGLRRIEAVTGYGAIEYIKSREALLQEAAALLKSRPEEISAKIQGLFGKTKELEHELATVQGGVAKATVEKLLAEVTSVSGVELAVGQVKAVDMDELRSLADMLRDRLTAGVVVLGAVQEGKVSFVAMATQAAQAKGIHAGNIIKEVAKAAGGGGGGRADMAQAGGKNPDKLTEALAVARTVVESQIKK
jgi:alanyl-tRNA synthetase